MMGGAFQRPLQQERGEDGGRSATVFLRISYCIRHQAGGQVEVKIQLLLPYQQSSCYRAVRAWRRGHLFQICPKGSTGQQQPSGDQGHENGLEEKMDSGHILEIEWTGLADRLTQGLEGKESQVTLEFFVCEDIDAVYRKEEQGKEESHCLDIFRNGIRQTRVNVR